MRLRERVRCSGAQVSRAQLPFSDEPFTANAMRLVCNR